MRAFLRMRSYHDKDMTEISKQPKHTKKVLLYIYMGVSENSGTPKSSILIGFSIINHPFWGTPIFGNTHIYIYQRISKNQPFSFMAPG